MSTVTIEVRDAERAMLLRQSVLEIGAEGAEPRVQVDSGAGLGGDFVLLTYRTAKGVEHKGIFNLGAVAAQWIEAIDNPDVEEDLLRALRSSTPEEAE